MRAVCYALALADCFTGVAALSGTRGGLKAAPAGEIELKTIGYRDLCATVRAQRGKVVVVEIWAEY
jgi:hypothetical protein